MASRVMRPRPGHEKMISVTNAPESKAPIVNPKSVINGLSAFRTACLNTTVFSSSPFARAVVT